MKKNCTAILMMLMLALVLLFTACGGETAETAGMGDMEEIVSPQDDPNEGLGGDLNEDTVNDFSNFEGIWLGETDNDYDYLEIDAEGNWTLYLGGDVIACGAGHLGDRAAGDRVPPPVRLRGGAGEETPPRLAPGERRRFRSDPPAPPRLRQSRPFHSRHELRRP